VTKKFLKKTNERRVNLEKKLAEGSNAKLNEKLNRLKRLGVFIKSYNMSHLLATRYKLYKTIDIKSMRIIKLKTP
jgi:hypothetical protein